MTVQVHLDSSLAHMCLGVVEIAGVSVDSASPQLRSQCAVMVANAVTESTSEENEQLRQEVRQMLRFGKFKASGRSKPAQEYLLRCATQEGQLPEINAPVEWLNAVSLLCNLPVSLLSIRKCSETLEVRRGAAGESYVFNSSGQVLDVTDLVVSCDVHGGCSRPVGSPVKDSMVGKIEADDRHLVAIVYAPASPLGMARRDLACRLLSDGFEQYCAQPGACVSSYSVPTVG